MSSLWYKIYVGTLQCPHTPRTQHSGHADPRKGVAKVEENKRHPMGAGAGACVVCCLTRDVLSLEFLKRRLCG